MVGESTIFVSAAFVKPAPNTEITCKINISNMGVLWIFIDRLE